MSTTLSTGILIFFAISAFVSLAFSAWQEGALKQLTYRIPAHLFKQFAGFLLVLGACLGLRGFFSNDAWSNELLFAAGALAPFLLKRWGVPSPAIGILLLLLVVQESGFVPEHLPATALLSTFLGFGVYKILENLLFTSESRFDDVLPPMLWLGGSYWLNTVVNEAVKTKQEQVFLVCLAVVLLLKIVQSFYLAEDKDFIKRFLLIVTSGLFFLIILNKIVLMPNMLPLTALFAAGLCFAYLFEPVGRQPGDASRMFDPIFFLVLLGILTLAATRLFGTFGLLILGSTALVSTVPEGIVLAGIFWISRVLLQAFVSLYNPNVTGINLMHSYTSAALYGGILTIILLSLIICDAKRRWRMPVAILAATVAIPPALMYFLHEEPTGSFLVAATVGAISIASLASFIYKGEDTAPQANLVLIPALMTVVGLLSGPLIDMGNSATAASRVQLVGYMMIVLAVVYMLFYLYRQRTSKS